MESSNDPVPSYYISDIQYSRMYALAYLDQQLRQTQPKYPQFAAAYIEQVRSATGAMIAQDLAKLMGGQAKLTAFINSVPDAAMYFERYVKHIRHLNPRQSFTDALEENQLWAATNSIVYIYITQAFDEQLKQDSPDGVGVFKHNALDPKHMAVTAKRILLNMMFINTVRMDPVPSVLDGYDFNLLEDIINNKDNGKRAIVLPSNATCC
jgi:hypothetical protein